MHTPGGGAPPQHREEVLHQGEQEMATDFGTRIAKEVKEEIQQENEEAARRSKADEIEERKAAAMRLSTEGPGEEELLPVHLRESKKRERKKQESNAQAAAHSDWPGTHASQEAAEVATRTKERFEALRDRFHHSTEKGSSETAAQMQRELEQMDQGRA